MYKPYKILMLATSMEYGGGETHLLELSKYLKSNGADVKIILNNSELLEKEIKNSGIEHINAPFHSRNIFDMRKSGEILKKVIKSYKPDIIHAHSRIPAFVAAKICKKFKIPLITTMHGTFKQSSFLVRLATNWGDYSLYVSGDIKDYWQKYDKKLKSGYMTKTVNGINTDLFNPNTDTDIKRELKIKPEEKIILSVSRLENRSGFNLAFTAIKLCEIAEDIYARDKNTRIIIVGDGEMFADIKNKAEIINKKLGFEYIIMTGRRVDAGKFCTACEVAVGISRFALEVLACAKPVIMCGDMGYLGRFTKENSEKCEISNFTCRNFGYPENVNKALLDEIFFCLDPENKNRIESDANFGAELVREKYSVKKMADDAYSVYQKAVLKYKKDYDFVLSGYYGYGNTGDDTLLFTVINNISQKKPDIKICLLTNHTKKIQKWLDNYFANIVSKHRYNFLTVKKSIKKSKALVFGGGTLLQDSTSARSFGYYSWLLKTAQKLGKKTILYANGIGPIYYKKNQKKAEETLKNITFATIRDKESYNSLIEMGIDKNKLAPTADEAITVKQNSNLNAYKKDFKEFLTQTMNHAIPVNYIVISVRKWKYLNADFFGVFSAAVDIICRENNLIPVYIVMEPKNDRSISEHLSTLNGRAYLADVSGDIEKVLAVVRSAEAVISMRFHTLVFAAAFGIPMIGISIDPKIGSFLNDVFDSDIYTVELKSFTKNMLAEKFKILMSDKENVKNKIAGAADRLCGEAAENADLFIKAMDYAEGGG